MYDLQILVNGKPIRRYSDREGNLWVEGRKESEFEIRISNDSWNRVLSVVSVDGLNVIDGKHETPENSRGYILNGKKSITIPGWKINENEVRKFYFTNKQDSFSRKVGADERNIGVIAVAIFTEKICYSIVYPNVWPVYIEKSPTYRDDVSFTTSNTGCFTSSVSSNSFVEADCHYSRDYNSDERKISVGSGDKSDFVTHKTDFNRDKLDKMLVIYYDDYEGLKKRGIIVKTSEKRPKPFAGVTYYTREYCPDR